MFNIDKNKILKNKSIVNEKPVSIIESAYSYLQKNDTPVNRLKYMDIVRHQPCSSVIEHLNLIYSIPNQGIRYTKHLLKYVSLTESELIGYKNGMVNYLNSLKESNYDDNDHILALEQTLSEIDDMIVMKKDELEPVNDIKDKMAIMRVQEQSLFESYLQDDMEIIINNIDYDPDVVNDLEKLIRLIRTSDGLRHVASFPKLLVMNTMMLINMELFPTGTVLNLVTCLPTVISDKLIENDAKKSVAKEHKRIIDNQITKIHNELKDGDHRKYRVYREYLKELRKASESLDKYCRYTVIESAFDKYSNTLPPYKKDSLRKDIDEISEFIYQKALCCKNNSEIITTLAINNTHLDVYKNKLSDFDIDIEIFDGEYIGNLGRKLLQEIKDEACAKFRDLLDDISINIFKGKIKVVATLSDDEITEPVDESTVQEGIPEMQPDIVPYTDGTIEDIAAEMDDTMLELFDALDKDMHEMSLECLTRLSKLEYMIESYYGENEIVEEDVKKSVIRTANKAQQGSRKVASKLNQANKERKRVTKPISKIPEPFINMVNQTINRIKEADKKERRERIITGEYKLKLINIIKKSIMFIASGAVVATAIAGTSLVTPVLTAIGVLTAFAVDKHIDARERKKILFELESELKIVNEKIDDAKSDGDKQAKYQLMRIQQKLEKDVEKIKFNLKN